MIRAHGLVPFLFSCVGSRFDTVSARPDSETQLASALLRGTPRCDTSRRGSFGGVPQSARSFREVPMSPAQFAGGGRREQVLTASLSSFHSLRRRCKLLDPLSMVPSVRNTCYNS